MSKRNIAEIATTAALIAPFSAYGALAVSGLNGMADANSFSQTYGDFLALSAPVVAGTTAVYAVHCSRALFPLTHKTGEYDIPDPEATRKRFYAGSLIGAFLGAAAMFTVMSQDVEKRAESNPTIAAQALQFNNN